jgi:hypothetical protein
VNGELSVPRRWTPRWLLAVALACVAAIAVGVLNLRAFTPARAVDPVAAGTSTPAAGQSNSSPHIGSPSEMSPPAPPTLPGGASAPALAGIDVFDYTSGAVDPSQERRWARAALAADALRLLSIRLARPDIAARLFAPGTPAAATDGLLPLVERLAADGRPVALTGAPRWTSVGVYRLEPTQKAAFALLGVQVGDDALLVSELGPVTVWDGEVSATIVPAVGSLNLLLPGQEVRDPQLGDIWRASYAVECRAGDPEVSVLCTGD